MNSLLYASIAGGNALAVAAFFIAALASAIFALVILAKRKNLKSSYQYFIWICVAVAYHSILTLVALTTRDIDMEIIAKALRHIGILFLPGLLLLHTWKNVSYKRLTAPVKIAALLIPVLAAANLVMNVCDIGVLPPFMESILFELATRAVLYAYFIVAIIRAYLLCFNVFYQMPRHMRRSTHRILAAVTALVLRFIALPLADMLVPDEMAYIRIAEVLLPVLEAILLTVAVYNLYEALFFPAKNVIATSRDFVFGRLSTLVLVLSENERILDWNRKDKQGSRTLPGPKYMEKFGAYRDRVLRETGGRVSPYDSNVISAMEDGRELHYTFSACPIVNEEQRFGFVVEISEITRIYSVLRELEDFAMTDQLTGMYNRNAYIKSVPGIALADNMPLAVLVGDVNNLKYINDHISHLSGDQLLKCVSGIILNNLPEDTFAARVGGDEFILLMPRAGSEVAESFVKAVNAECKDISSDLFGTPSIAWGYAVLDSGNDEYDEKEYEDAVLQADAMMYRQKKLHHRFRSSALISAQHNMEDGSGD